MQRFIACKEMVEKGAKREFGKGWKKDLKDEWFCIQVAWWSQEGVSESGKLRS